MNDWFDEMYDEFLGDEFPDETFSEEMEIPDVDWAEDLEQIDNPEILEKEINAAEKIIERENDLEERLDSGEINEDQYLNEYEFWIKDSKRKATTRSGLEAVGMTYDDLGDLSEDWDILISGTPEIAQLKDQLKSTIDSIGSEAAQELADNMLEEGRLSKSTHDTITRQVRLNDK